MLSDVFIGFCSCFLSQDFLSFLQQDFLLSLEELYSLSFLSQDFLQLFSIAGFSCIGFSWAFAAEMVKRLTATSVKMFFILIEFFMLVIKILSLRFP
ncbi:hypothetical protein HMPREF9072_00268 [Capnocytophaga sp. oral taxon 324 str. F0483]|nr:hypothetical protein HMPREF9072_00268 [Capnocytophaga sp. oral taxon 324 str. F0483]